MRRAALRETPRASGRRALYPFGMVIVVSPYHITTREAPAVAAMLLADRVVTMMPAPEDGPRRERVENIAGRVPRYLRFLESWRWTVPLWEAGVLGSALEGVDASEDVRTVNRRVAADERFTALRPLMRPDLFDDEDGYLDAVATDLLKGGPDPAISVPVAAAMDRFALRHSLVSARSEALSVAQRAEERLGSPVFAIAAPVLLRTGAARILAARELLEPELAGLRSAMDRRITENGGGDPRPLKEAAGAYAAAFERGRAEIEGPVDDDEEGRVVCGVAAVSAVRLPIDAVLESSVAAYRAVSGAPALRSASDVVSVAMAEHDELAGRIFTSLIFRVIGRPSNGGRASGGP